MPMTFTDEHIYDAPLEAVRRMYFDTGFCPRKYAALGLEDLQVIASSDRPDDFFVDCRFVMEPTLPLPGFIRKLLPGGEKITVRQIDRWNTTTGEGELDIRLLGLERVSIHSAMKLAEHPRGAANRMDWRISCDVPLVGSKLAEFLGRDIQRKSQHDLEISTAILADYL